MMTVNDRRLSKILRAKNNDEWMGRKDDVGVGLGFSFFFSTVILTLTSLGIK